MAHLSLSGVAKSFEDVTALEGVDLAVNDGELMVVVGPSGCGKSTLLRVISGLEDVDSGTISIGGVDVTTMHPSARDIGMVFQSYALFPHLTVAENIGIGLTVRGVGKAEVARKVREVAELVGCADKLDRTPIQLSGGERQRAALARAIVREPKVFLLDEPLSSLDAQLRSRMRVELELLQDRIKATMVYVTHDQIEALTLGDRIAVMNEGVIQQVGSPEDIYYRPANKFVAGFIGTPSMNFVPASLKNGSIDAGPLKIVLSGQGMNEKYSTVTIGIRPEDIKIVAIHEGVTAKIEVVEMVGNESYVHLKVGDLKLVIKTDTRTNLSKGSEVGVVVSAKHVHIFDESGKAIRHAS